MRETPEPPEDVKPRPAGEEEHAPAGERPVNPEDLPRKVTPRIALAWAAGIVCFMALFVVTELLLNRWGLLSPEMGNGWRLAIGGIRVYVLVVVCQFVVKGLGGGRE